MILLFAEGVRVSHIFCLSMTASSFSRLRMGSVNLLRLFFLLIRQLRINLLIIINLECYLALTPNF